MTKSVFKVFLIAFFIVSILFILGATETTKVISTDNNPVENFHNTNPKCPDMLIKEGNKLLLLNSSKPREKGVNPIIFNNLDGYIKHLETERSKGKKCPVLFLQKEVNTQGEEEYRVRPGPFDMQGGAPIANDMNMNLEKDREGNIIPLDANRDGKVYNKNQHFAFDPHNMHMGQFTAIDNIHNSTVNGKFSDNAMDSNWGGFYHTKRAVEKGKYKDREVVKPMLFTPMNEVYNTEVPTQFEPPKDVLS